MRSLQSLKRRSLLAAVATAATVGSLAAAVPAVAHPAPHTAKAVRGDFDGDGRTDLALGAPGSNRVRVSYTKAKPAITSLTTAQPSHTPLRFGAALATGDFNHDGYADLAVGAPNYTDPDEDRSVFDYSTEGAVFVYLGSPTGLKPTPLKIKGPHFDGQNYHLGMGLASADVNGDGRDDIVAEMNSGTDSVQVYFAGASGFSASYGQSLESDIDSFAIGDINGDGRPDLVVGLTDYTGADDDEFQNEIAVHYGTGAKFGPRHVIFGKSVGMADDLGDGNGGAEFGQSVAVGDVNGDKYADVAVGVPFATSTGKSHGAGAIVLFTGSKSGLSAQRHETIHESKLAKASAVDRFGTSLAIARLGTDKYGDLVVGATGVAVGGYSQAGAVYVVHGYAHGLTVKGAQRITQSSPGVAGGATSNARFGASLFLTHLAGATRCGAVIGAPGASANNPKGGYVVKLPGTTTGLTGSKSTGVSGVKSNEALGTAIA